MNGMITCAEHFSVPECLERIRAYRVEGTVERVTRKEAQVYPALRGAAAPGGPDGLRREGEHDPLPPEPGL